MDRTVNHRVRSPAMGSWWDKTECDGNWPPLCKLNLYSLGVRKIGVTTLPPTGCLPAAVTLFGMGSNNCISRLNNDTVVFNKKLNATSSKLIARFPDLKLVVFDVYHPLLDIITKPAKNVYCIDMRYKDVAARVSG
ncbi:GDSL esterase/lipase [Artemisia annua]|uniref:GDSL esterase/lipase n=1 Tax=Artemisia annua TaxID=35608 RepID=A0A2U1M8H6_ARTAN|nr:GDSL esterase/lipase [Artemisia annua]